MRKVLKGKLAAIITIGETDVKFFVGENEIFYCFTSHSPEELRCFLFNFNAEVCGYESCRECPDATYFIELEDGEIIPVLKLQT